jgi:hypothetical protein
MPARRQASEALWSGDPDLSKPGGPKTKPHKSENGSQCKSRDGIASSGPLRDLDEMSR